MTPTQFIFGFSALAIFSAAFWIGYCDMDERLQRLEQLTLEYDYD